MCREKAGGQDEMRMLRAMYAEGEERLRQAGIEEAGLDAWYLLEFVTGVDKAHYYMEPDRRMEQSVAQEYEKVVNLRAEHIPLQHITGVQEFMGLGFRVSGDVLIPRQDTEVLVEEALKRLEQGKPVLDALLSWANEMQAKTAPKSALGRAIHYLLEQWPYLTRYLEDGRLELSNNRAERSIKPFVMGRKNWLFANTPGGAQASAVIYSLIETAKENALDPYRYLLWVLQNAPQLSETGKAWAEKLLPARAPKECYMPHK